MAQHFRAPPGPGKRAAAPAPRVSQVGQIASHLLLASYDLQTIQRLLGHADIKTSMIYLQIVPPTDAQGSQKPAGLFGRSFVAAVLVAAAALKVQSSPAPDFRLPTSDFRPPATGLRLLAFGTTYADIYTMKES